MKLTRPERLTLSNQYRILEKLDPDNAEEYAAARNIVERGYEYEYDDIAQHVYGDSDVTTEEESEEVVEILAMFDGLKQSYSKLSDKTGINKNQIEFSGFDGNNEGKQMGYAKHFCESGGGRFTDLENGDNFNSPLPMLPVYRRMLGEWKKINPNRQLQLTKEEIEGVVGARAWKE